MTPEENIYYASLWLWVAGYIAGIASVAAVALLAIKLGFRIRRVESFSVGGGGLINNGGAYRALLADGYFIEEQRTLDAKQHTVIFPTRKLLDALKVFFEKNQ